MMRNPFFSIIVVSLNAEKTISQTINSVLSQTFDDYEIIVKDGLSKDNTVENIPASDKIKIYEQADESIYEAMNQAIDYATGRFILFLNCGDTLYDDNVLSKMYSSLKDVKEDICAIGYGNYLRGGCVRKQPQNLNNFHIYRTPLCHQTLFYSKETFNKFGRYDLTYKICADCDLNNKAFFGGAEFIYNDIVISEYMGGGVSETGVGADLCTKEFKSLRKKYFNSFERLKYGGIIVLSLRPVRSWCASDNAPRFVRRLYTAIINRIVS